MKKIKDKRITANSVSWKQFLLIFITIVFACGSYLATFLKSNQDEQNGFPLVMLGNLLAISFLIAFFIGIFKKYYFDRPIQTIADATKKVTEGDFSVRIPHHRKDGKKDYLEILIDDFNTMASELATIETLKTDFITNVSHEIKTPLSVIQSYATAIQDDELPADERREYGKIIVEASKKLTELIANILKLNKLENQEILPAKEPFALDEQLRECVLSYEEVWDKKNITFIGDDIDEVKVNCDKSLLEIVWNNLISNAIKFTDNGGTITLSLKNDNDFAVVTIKDSGCGMNEETVARIFDKFYQGDTSHSTEGNGLGLALVKKVITLLGGQISVTSRENEGTVFTVKLKI